MLVELAHAKINLTLDILGRRPDGYHELETVMQTIRLSDRLSFAPAKGGVFLSVNSLEVPGGKDNLIYRAAVLLMEYTGKRCAAAIRLEKNIPVAAGLAGGSADAAAALKGLNKFWKVGLSDQDLLFLGEQLGADVPFCLCQGTMLARGKGEILSPLPSMRGRGVVLVKAPFGLSTAHVYQLYDQKGGSPRPDQRAMCAALKEGDSRAVGRLLANALEKAAFLLRPELEKVKEAVRAAGVLGASISGSGPTVFGLCADEDSARKAAARLKLPLGYTVLVTVTV